MSNTTATMAVRRSDTGDLCRGGRFHGVTAALFVVAAMATWPHNAPAAVTVPAANYSIPGVHGSQPRTFHHDFSNDDHQLIYSGVASGGIKPQADLQGSFTIHNLRPPSYNFPLVHSVVQYFFVVDGPGTPEDYILVPIVLTAAGEVSASGSGFATASVGFASDFSPHPRFVTWSSVSASSAAGPTADFSIEEHFQVYAHHLYGVELRTSGGFSNDQVSGDFQALSDPNVYIDPAFADAGLFSMRYSEGIISVPEPSTLPLLVVLSIGALARVRRPRRDVILGRI